MTTTTQEKNAIARVNRRLQRDGGLYAHKVQITRSPQVRQNHGRFVLVDPTRNQLVDSDNNLSWLVERIENRYLTSEGAA